VRCAYSWASYATTTPGGLGGDIACAVAAPDGLRLLIGDVMGHDPRAARTAAAVSQAFRRLASRPEALPLPAIAERLHAFVAGHVGGEVFVTAQLVAVPAARGREPEIVCCGHPPALLLRGGRATALDALPPALPLGLLDLAGCGPRADRLPVRPGDRVLLYTDGVSEALDPRGLPYPLADRAAALTRQDATRAPGAGGGRRGRDAGLPGRLSADLLRHSGGRLRDDATLLCLRFAGDQEKAEGAPARPAGLAGSMPTPAA
jgi:serine phosphatase RsbU (regulator of sigma subunit)